MTEPNGIYIQTINSNFNNVYIQIIDLNIENVYTDY